MSHSDDRIIYTLLDNSRPETPVIAAHFNKADALEQIQRAKVALVIKPEVVDVSALRQQILDRLNPIERLVMDPPRDGGRRALPPEGR